MSEYVAVYGSLLRGCYNHVSLGSDSELIGEGIVKGFGMYSLGPFPALCREGKHTNVVIELYHVSDKTMDNLDILEGAPSYYTRKLCPILINGETVPAWVYYMEGKLDDEFVESGDWVSYLKGKK